jgi:hypothetical protein
MSMKQLISAVRWVKINYLTSFYIVAHLNSALELRLLSSLVTIPPPVSWVAPLATC